MTEENKTISLYDKIWLITHEMESVSQDTARGVPYKITSWNAVNKVVKESLKNHKILIIPHVLDHSKDGNLTTITINADIIDRETNSKITVGNYVGYGVDPSDKGFGKAMTYAYRYLLMKVFMMEVGSDEDSEFSNPTATETKKEPRKEHSI